MMDAVTKSSVDLATAFEFLCNWFDTVCDFSVRLPCSCFYFSYAIFSFFCLFSCIEIIGFLQFNVNLC